MRLVPLTTPASRGLLYQAWMVDEYGIFSGMRNGEKTELLGDKLQQYHFVHQKFHLT
jgi:hypothetical protein